MKSPFPGMDPYIEACGLWRGFHNRLIYNIDETLARILPQGYTIDIGARNYVVLMEAEGKKEHVAEPDDTVTKPAGRKKPRKGKGGVAVAEPDEATESVRMQAFVAAEFEESFVEIYVEGEDRILVTCIEVLSPSNKQQGTKGWRKYQRKRQAMLLGRANFIEIDLLRGDKFPMLTPWPKSPHALLVCRQDDAPYCRVWPASLRRRLPVIPVPLLEPDPDLRLDLQPLLDHIYTLGRYDERIDYARPLTPALSDEDTGWLRELLRERTARSPRKSRRSS